KLTRENRRSAGRIQARFWGWGRGRPPRGEWKLPTSILLGASHKRAMLWTTARGAANLISSEAADGSANDPRTARRAVGRTRNGRGEGVSVFTSEPGRRGHCRSRFGVGRGRMG